VYWFAYQTESTLIDGAERGAKKEGEKEPMSRGPLFTRRKIKEFGKHEGGGGRKGAKLVKRTIISVGPDEKKGG